MGRPQLIREELPSSKQDLEATIVRKFVGAVRDRDGRQIVLNERTDPNGWPDFDGSCDGRPIGIEVVEAVVPDHARKRARQKEYLEVLLPRVEDLKDELRGLAVAINDGYQDPEWPPVNSTAGRQLVSELEANLRASVPDLQRTGPRGGGLIWSKPPHVCTGVDVMRGLRLGASAEAPVDLYFRGTFPLSGQFLAHSVMRKIANHYVRYPQGDLWLLTYDEHGAVTQPDSVELARRVLMEVDHPFSAVWALHPHPRQDGGQLEVLFP